MANKLLHRSAKAAPGEEQRWAATKKFVIVF
jgi:hypothetical protein